MTTTKLQFLLLALVLGVTLSAGLLLAMDAVASSAVSSTVAPSAVRLPDIPPSSGGPDAFGYHYVDSQPGGNPELYNWVDIAATGQLIAFGNPDEDKVLVDLPQAVTFYGREHAQLYVTTNGYASFVDGDVVRECTPGDGQPPESLAAFCSDLRVDGAVYYATAAYNGHHTFIVQYDRIMHMASGQEATFQIVLDFEDGSITYQYLFVPSDSAAETTIGITGYATNVDDYLTYCRSTNDCPPQDAMAVRFELSPHPVLDVQIMPSDGFPVWGDTVGYTITTENIGEVVAAGAVMTNPLPDGLDIVSDTLQASAGTSAYDVASRTVSWQGDLAVDGPVVVTYDAVLNTDEALFNTAVASHPQALEPAGATSSPLDDWGDPELVDGPQFFDDRLGSWRYIAVDGGGTAHIAYGGAHLYYGTLSEGDWIIDTVPVSPTNPSAAALVLDDQDYPIIAFYGDDHLWVTRKTATMAGIEWTLDQVAHIDISFALGKLDLQRASDGTLHLAYDYDKEIHYTRYDGASWRPSSLVIRRADCWAGDGFSLALDDSGTAHVACVHRADPIAEVRMYGQSASTPWTTYEVIATGGAIYHWPSIVFDGPTPHASYFEGEDDLYHAQRDMVWTTELVTGPETTLRNLGTVVDVDGGQVGIAYAGYNAWGDYPYEHTYRLAMRPLDGTEWAKTTLDTFPGDFIWRRPTLAMDESGWAHVAYYRPSDQTLRYVGPSAPATEAVAASRQIGDTALALGSDASIHLAYLSQGLRYASVPSDTVTWAPAVVVEGVSDRNEATLDLALGSENTPHVVYHEGPDQPLVHAMPGAAYGQEAAQPLSPTAWTTQQVDAPGNVPANPSLDTGADGTVHVAYGAVEGADLVVRHGWYDGVAWRKATVAVGNPDAGLWGPSPRPALVAQGGKVYVLYADCTAYHAWEAHPVELVLATLDGGVWSAETLYRFRGTCDQRMLDYQLLGDGANELAMVATIVSEFVRPSPLQVIVHMDHAGRRSLATGQASLGSSPPAASAAAEPDLIPTQMMLTFWPRFELVIKELLETVTIRGDEKLVQRIHGPLISEPTVARTGIEPTAQVTNLRRRGGNAAVVEGSRDRNHIYAERTRPRPECCLILALNPSDAADAGCTVSAANWSGRCGSQTQVTAKEVEGWLFSHWTGAATGSSKTSSATLSGEIPACSLATAHFKPAPMAQGVKVADPGVDDRVYPHTRVTYTLTLSYKGDEDAVIFITDTYPYTRSGFVNAPVRHGRFINRCDHNSANHNIICSGLFPESNEGVSSWVSFAVSTTCDIWKGGGNLRNSVLFHIGDFRFVRHAETAVKVPFELRASTPTFIPNPDFESPHSILLYTVPKGDEMPLPCMGCSNSVDLWVVANGDTPRAKKMENGNRGATDRRWHDFNAGDCHHSLWFEPVDDGPQRLDLYLVAAGEPFHDSYLAHTLTLQPRPQPRLVVLTDLRELFQEFGRTSAGSPIADADNNHIKDFYDAVERIHRYANAHSGVVLDVRQDAYLRDFDYTTDAVRDDMGLQIDWLISMLPHDALGYVAIVGDDAVLPFFRYPDPLDGKSIQERTYLSGHSHNVPTVKDTHAGFLMSDLPYSTKEAKTPKLPSPSLASGRIFASTPRKLVDMIDAYETALIVGSTNGSAFVFNIANEALPSGKVSNHHEGTWRRATTILRASGYVTTPVASILFRGQPGYLGWYDAQRGRTWGGTTVAQSFTVSGTRRNRISYVVAHANHLSHDTPVADDLDAADIDAIGVAPGCLLLSWGCHAGYSTGWDAAAGAVNYYQAGLVRAMLEKHLTYHANTTYGIFEPSGRMVQHDVVRRRFLRNVLAFSNTTGAAHRRSQQAFPEIRPEEEGDYDSYALYAIELYGLPTQPIQRTGAPAVARSAAGLAIAQRTGRAQESMRVAFGIPNLRVTLDDWGHTLFEVPNGGLVTSQGVGPLLPLLSRNVPLPAGASNINVTLRGSSAETWPEPVQLPPLELASGTFGPLPIEASVSEPYPTQIWASDIATQANGIELRINVVPLQWNPTSGQLTVIRSLDLQVDYDLPVGNTTVATRAPGGGEPVRVGQQAITLAAEVTTDEQGPLQLHWFIDDSGGMPLRGGYSEFTPQDPATELTWSTDSIGWLPGSRVLHVLVEDSTGRVLATAQEEFVAQGSGLLLQSDRTMYGPTDTTATFTAEVRDEAGAPVTGLANDLQTQLNGSDIALTWTEGQTYEATLDTTTLQPGSYSFQVALQDAAPAEAGFGIDRDPPTSTLTSPAVVSTSAFSVTISGDDDVSGVDTYHLQYRVDGGDWIDWLTLQAGWNYDAGAPADLSPVFGPTEPIAPQAGHIYCFRGRAVDRVGNAEAEHAEPDACIRVEGARTYLPLVRG